MIREEYLRRLVDAAHIEIYLSSVDGARIYWPWRMTAPKDSSKRYRNACEKYIIDSDPLDDDVTTSDVLDCAYRCNAETASLQDVYLDKDATVDRLLEGLEISDSHPFDGELLLPLQAPYVDCWKELGEPRGHMIGIGGLKAGTPMERLSAVRELRQEVGPNVWIHGFGWGPKEIASEIRKDPDLLDSVDYSTPLQTSIDAVDTPGDERMSVVAAFAGAKLVRDLREVSSYPTEKTPADYRVEGETGLDEFA